MMPVWAGMAIVLGALGAGLAILAVYQRLASPDPEIPRKLLHVVMGLVTLTLPVLFDDAWPVVLLAGLALAGLLAVRYVQVARSSVGEVLHAVGRDSVGELCFPVAVAVVFVLSIGGPSVMYLVPILMLTLADATAALVGLRYGRPRHQMEDEPKSLEGSVAFFAVAFLSALVPLLLLTDVGRAEVLVVSAILGLLVAVLEAVSKHGVDNLLIPVGAYVFLAVHLGATTTVLLVRLTVLLALIAFGLWWRSRTTFSHRGVLAAALAGYMYWTLAGWQWLLAPIAMFLTFTLLPPLSAEEPSQLHDSRVVAAVALPGLVWAFGAAVFGAPQWLYPFSVLFAAQLATNGFARLTGRLPAWSHPAQLGFAVAKAWGFVIAPWFVLAGPTIPRLGLLLDGAGLTLIAGGGAYALYALSGSAIPDRRRAWLHSGIALGTSLVALWAMEGL